MKSTIKDELLDELLKGYSQPGDLLGPDGLFTDLFEPFSTTAHFSEATLRAVEKTLTEKYGKARPHSHARRAPRLTRRSFRPPSHQASMTITPAVTKYRLAETTPGPAIPLW
ncbi:MAG: hypothetical protein ACRCXD_07250 [Luteolibacter sp.]